MHPFRNKRRSHPTSVEAGSDCRTLLVTVNGTRRVCGWQTRKTWLERAASARRSRGDQRIRHSFVGGVGRKQYWFYLHREEAEHGALTHLGGIFGAARRGWLAVTAADHFPDVAVTFTTSLVPPPESQSFGNERSRKSTTFSISDRKRTRKQDVPLQATDDDRAKLLPCRAC